MEREAVKKVVEESYYKGRFADPNPDAMRRGFHPIFNIQIMKGSDVELLPITDFIGYLKKIMERNPNGPKYKWTCNIPLVDVTEDTAIAKMELFREGEHIYTDYLSLYKFEEEGWRIVNKIYHQHI